MFNLQHTTRRFHCSKDKICKPKMTKDSAAKLYFTDEKKCNTICEQIYFCINKLNSSIYEHKGKSDTIFQSMIITCDSDDFSLMTRIKHFCDGMSITNDGLNMPQAKEILIKMPQYNILQYMKEPLISANQKVLRNWASKNHTLFPYQEKTVSL